MQYVLQPLIGRRQLEPQHLDARVLVRQDLAVAHIPVVDHPKIRRVA
ncbi:hypothetical protein ACH492_13175 [Streptomyces sp. NPDC019443]